MSLSVFYSVLIASLVVIGVSILFIVRQLKQSQKRAKKIRQGQELLTQERQKRIDSILILLKSVGSEELGWIETSIRVKNLLDQLSLDLSGHKEISAFYLITEKTQHIPTHDQWLSLPGDARNKYRREMDGYEEAYKEQLIQAKHALLAYSLS